MDDEGFMATYNHDINNNEEDSRYTKIVFNKYSEQAWGNDGNPIADSKVLSKRGARKFSKEILQNWKKLTAEENESWI